MNKSFSPTMVYHSVSKDALAMLYFPEHPYESRIKLFRLWITTCKPLHDALCVEGYKQKSRYFTPRQVALIYEFLGEP